MYSILSFRFIVVTSFRIQTRRLRKIPKGSNLSGILLPLQRTVKNKTKKNKLQASVKSTSSLYILCSSFLYSYNSTHLSFFPFVKPEAQLEKSSAILSILIHLFFWYHKLLPVKDDEGEGRKDSSFGKPAITPPPLLGSTR